MGERGGSGSECGSIGVGVRCETQVISIEVWVCVDKVDVAEVEEVVHADGRDARDGEAALDGFELE